LLIFFVLLFVPNDMTKSYKKETFKTFLASSN